MYYFIEINFINYARSSLRSVNIMTMTLT